MLADHEIPDVIRALMVTAEAMGDALSSNAAGIMADDLSDYTMPVILQALKAVRQECKGRLALADILKRVQAQDGHPDGNEAWAIAVVAQDESATVVWTDQISRAYFVASSLLDGEGNVAARMAFLTAYERELKAARQGRVTAAWTPCLGHDTQLREVALTSAVSSGRLTKNAVAGLLAAPMSEAGAAIAGLLEGPTVDRAVPAPPHILKQLEALIVESRENENRRRIARDEQILAERAYFESKKNEQIAALTQYASKADATNNQSEEQSP